MGIRKRHALMNAFFKSQFNHCPLIWMCRNRSLNNKIDRLHERRNFTELLQKDGFVSIHYQNIRQLTIQMFKVSKGLCPEIMEGMFQFRNEIPSNLRQRSQIHIHFARAVFSGAEGIKFIGPKMWEFIRR